MNKIDFLEQKRKELSPDNFFILELILENVSDEQNEFYSKFYERTGNTSITVYDRYALIGNKTLQSAINWHTLKGLLADSLSLIMSDNGTSIVTRVNFK